MTEENEPSQICQNYLSMRMQTSFVAQGGIIVHANASIHAHVENSELQSILSIMGIDNLTLSTCSPELNLMNLVFNVVVQRFASIFNEPSMSFNYQVMEILFKAVDSVSPHISFSCY